MTTVLFSDTVLGCDGQVTWGATEGFCTACPYTKIACLLDAEGKKVFVGFAGSANVTELLTWWYSGMPVTHTPEDFSLIYATADDLESGVAWFVQNNTPTPTLVTLPFGIGSGGQMAMTAWAALSAVWREFTPDVKMATVLNCAGQIDPYSGPPFKILDDLRNQPAQTVASFLRTTLRLPAPRASRVATDDDSKDEG